MKVLNHATGMTQDIDTEKIKTVGQLKPSDEYSVLYERIVLSNSFPLSNISNTNAILDLWVTNPIIPTRKKQEEPTTVAITGTFDLRDLGECVVTPPPPPQEPEFSRTVNAFATVAKMSIEARVPDKLKEPRQITKILQHTPFSIVQKVYPIQVSPPYLGSTVTIYLNPRELGDLMSHMYFSCQLPPNIQYCPDVGRAIFRRVELYLNEQQIDWYDDDWSVIHDDLFADASERLVLDKILNGQRLLVPFLFFFCKKDSFLPLCAIQNQNIYIKLYFNDQSWITDYTGSLDILQPTLVFDQIFLSNEERLYYQTKPHSLIIPAIYRESPIQFTNGTVNINMTPNFHVNMISWFIRNQNYETTASEFRNRYKYGYVSNDTKSYTNFINWRGQYQKYLQTISSVDIFVNNYNIIKGMAGDLYFKYSQPIEHSLSIPDNDIFSYCFSKNPKDLKKRGELNFSTYASKTTNLKIKFLDTLVTELTQSYTLYLYYYGYVTLSIQNGFAVIQP
jgi:hypothetical protein